MRSLYASKYCATSEKKINNMGHYNAAEAEEFILLKWMTLSNGTNSDGEKKRGKKE